MKFETMAAIVQSEANKEKDIVQLVIGYLEEAHNIAIEEAASAMNNVFTEARDTDWDTGFNYCRDNFKNQIRMLKK